MRIIQSFLQSLLSDSSPDFSFKVYSTVSPLQKEEFFYVIPRQVAYEK